MTRENNDSQVDTRLFGLNPLPTWIYEIETLKFLQVNDAAIKAYGYTAEEFLQMTLKDIRPFEEIQKLEEVCKTMDERRKHFPGIFRHRKKNGDIITVDVNSNPVVFYGRKAKIVVASDITAPLEYVSFIEKQNQILQHIAHMQSHDVRAPLARVMGLVRLLTSPNMDMNIDLRILNMLSDAADDLDLVIRQVIELTNHPSSLLVPCTGGKTLNVVKPGKQESEETLREQRIRLQHDQALVHVSPKIPVERAGIPN